MYTPKQTNILLRIFEPPSCTRTKRYGQRLFFKSMHYNTTLSKCFTPYNQSRYFTPHRWPAEEPNITFKAKIQNTPAKSNRLAKPDDIYSWTRPGGVDPGDCGNTAKRAGVMACVHAQLTMLSSKMNASLSWIAPAFPSRSLSLKEWRNPRIRCSQHNGDREINTATAWVCEV